MAVELTGYITVPRDKLDAVRAALPEHIRLTLAEPGCLSFEVVESQQQPGRFDVTERFTDRAAFDHHQSRTKASAWAGITEGCERSYRLQGE